MSKSRVKKLNKIKNIVSDYVAVLEQESFPVKQAYFFGSFAKGNAHAESDIDVCVVSDKFRPNYERDRSFLWQKRRIIDYRIEPIGYNTADFKEPDPLVHEIKTYGIRVV